MSSTTVVKSFGEIKSTLQDLQSCIDTFESYKNQSLNNNGSFSSTILENVVKVQSEGQHLLQITAKQLQQLRILLSSTSLDKSDQNKMLSLSLAHCRRNLKQKFNSLFVWSQSFLRQKHLIPQPASSASSSKENDSTNSTTRAQQMIKSLNRSKFVVREILESTVAANTVLDEDAESLIATGRTNIEYGSTMSKASSRLAEMKRLEELANTRLKWSFGFFVCVWLFVIVRRMPFLNIFIWFGSSVVPRISHLFKNQQNQQVSENSCLVPVLVVDQYDFGQMKEWPAIDVSVKKQENQHLQHQGVVVCAFLVNKLGDSIISKGGDDDDDSSGSHSRNSRNSCTKSRDIAGNYLCYKEFPFKLDLNVLCRHHQKFCQVTFDVCCGGNKVNMMISGGPPNFNFTKTAIGGTEDAEALAFTTIAVVGGGGGGITPKGEVFNGAKSGGHQKEQLHASLHKEEKNDLNTKEEILDGNKQNQMNEVIESLSTETNTRTFMKEGKLPSFGVEKLPEETVHKLESSSDEL